MNKVFKGLTIFLISLAFFSCKKKKDTLEPINPNLEQSGSKWKDVSPKNLKGYDVSTFEISFVNEKEGYVLGTIKDTSQDIKEVVFTTIDGGENWTINNLPKLYNGVYKHLFAASDSVLFVGWNYGHYKSNDKGKTWKFMGEIDSQNNDHVIWFVSEKVGIGVHGRIIKSIDGAKSWNLVYDGPGKMGWLFNLKFINPNVGFAFGGFSFDDVGYGGGRANFGCVVKTLDQGNSWIPLDSALAHVSDVSFLNENIGYVFTIPLNIRQEKAGQLLKTTNGGTSWELVNNTLANDYPKGIFFNEMEGFSSGGVSYSGGVSGGIYYTKDMGKTWKVEHPDILIEDFFRFGNLIYALNPNGTILKRAL